MQQTLRPYVTTGLAVAGAGLVAVPTVVPHGAQLQQLADNDRREVALTADGGIFSAYTDLFNNTAANLQALNQNSVDMWGLLQHIFTNPDQALAGIPDVINIFTNVMPGIGVQVLPMPASIDIELPVWMNSILAGMGPWMALFAASQQLMDQIFDFSDPMGALSAIIGAPAFLLDAFLNGTEGFSFEGLNIPLFNGLLTPGQSIDADFNVGGLVELSGFGDTTLIDLLDQAGIGDVPLETMILDLLDGAGYGHMTPVDLLNDFGIGTEPLSELLIGLLHSAGIDNPSMAELLTDLGGIDPEDSIASLLIALLNMPGVDIGNPTLTDLVMSFLGEDATVGSLIKDLLGAQGSESLSSLVDPTWTVGGLIIDSFGNVPMTDLFESLGLGDVIVGAGITALFGEMGEQTLLEILDSGIMGPDFTGSTGLMELFAGMFPPGTTLADMMTDFGDMTLGELMEDMPFGENTIGIDPETPLLEVKFTDLLLTVNLPGTDTPIGSTHLSEMPGLPPDMASKVDKIGDPVLNQLLGSNNVGDTLKNMGFYDATITQLVQAMELDDYPLADLFLGLGNLSGNVTLGDFLTDLGFNPTLNELMLSLFEGMGLGDTSVLQLFTDWGMSSIGLENFITGLGLQNMNLQDMLNNLGFNNIDLDMVIDRFGLSNISIEGLLNGLGMGDQHLNDAINDLLGAVSIGSMLGGLGLDEVHLDDFLTDVMTSILGDPTLGTLLGWLGLDTNDLNTIVSSFGLDGVTLDSLLTDLGFGDLDINGLLDGLGLTDLGLLSINGEFFGLAAEWFNDIPNQIAEALGYTG